VLDAIGDAVDLVDPARGPVVDLFSGSGVVAAALARTRDVVAVDVQEYARVLASALLAPARLTYAEGDALAARAKALADERTDAIQALIRHERLAAAALVDGDAEPLCEIVEHGSLRACELGQGPDSAFAEVLEEASEALACLPVDSTIMEYYGGVYFGYEQALELDALLTVARTLNDREWRDTAIAAVLGAASECVTSVGSHFAQPIRPRAKDGQPKVRALLTLARRRKRSATEAFADRLRSYARLSGAASVGTAVRQDYRDFLEACDGDVGVVYADPPYTRDHYSRFYHVLETMARGDRPELSTVTVAGRTSLSRGLYRQDRHQSSFSIRSQVPEAFRALLDGVRRIAAPLVLSYSPCVGGTVARPQPRMLTIPELSELALEAFDSVDVVSAGRLSHSRFNAERVNGEIDQEAEVLLICRP
jgi:adenine-specific DNA-methyltransferase